MQNRNWSWRHGLLLLIALLSLAGCRLSIEARRGREKAQLQDLFAAVEAGKLDEVDELINAHPEWINARSDLGNSPLFVAAYHGHHDIAQRLVDAGASLDNGGSADMAPLHAASIRGHTNIANLLLNAGCNANVQDSQGRTPLFYAAQEGHAELAETLLASGANDSLADRHGQTPLDIARGRQHGQVVDLLTRSAVR